jgi:hypothetical protein
VKIWALSVKKEASQNNRAMKGTQYKKQPTLGGKFKEEAKKKTSQPQKAHQQLL